MPAHSAEDQYILRLIHEVVDPIKSNIDELMKRLATPVEPSCEDCPAREILMGLVSLKTHKDEFGKDDFYCRTQPELWQRARKILKEPK